MASIIYNSALYDALTGAIDFDTDTFKAMLVTSAYTPNKDTHTKRNQVTNEVGASGSYSAGGGTATVSRGLVYYKSRGGASSADELVAFIDFGSDVTSTAGTFAVTASTLRIQN